MYNKTKNNSVPSDAQARERLATYVYEYLLHVGANKASAMFLQEIGWDKSIQVGESPGFLHSWWCVFWDLYCASPEKRDTCEHSTEAKVYHDYSSSSHNPPPPDGMQPGMHHSYFPPFMSLRYSHGAPRHGMQGPGAPPAMMQGMDHPRQGQMMGMNRMVHPRGMPSGSMNPYGSEQFQQPYGGMRLPPSTMPNHGGMPMPPMHARSPWPNQSAQSGPSSVGPPTTPMMRSPQGPRPRMQPGSNSHRFPSPHDPKNPDPMNSEYVHMKQMQQHQQPLTSSFPIGPDNIPPSTLSAAQVQGMAASTANMTSGLNGMNGSGPDPGMMDGLSKSSPGNNIPMAPIGSGVPSAMGPPGGPGGTPHTPQDGEGDSFNIGFGDNHQDQSDTAAILKIKECMQQDAKRFETKEADGGAGTGAEFNFLP